MKNNTWAVWGPLRPGALGPGLRPGALGPGPGPGPLDKTALHFTHAHWKEC